MYPPDADIELDKFVLHDLSKGPPPVNFEEFDYVLMLDVIEHLPNPELFIAQLREKMTFAPDVTLIVSTGNVAFFIVRFMLLMGQFNFGKRGILDITHTRLFTFASFRRLFEQGGFKLVETRGIPAPFALAIGPGLAGRILLAINQFLIRVMRSVFSYQILMVAKPYPSLALLLRDAQHYSAKRAEAVAPDIPVL